MSKNLRPSTWITPSSIRAKMPRPDRRAASFSTRCTMRSVAPSAPPPEPSVGSLASAWAMLSPRGYCDPPTRPAHEAMRAMWRGGRSRWLEVGPALLLGEPGLGRVELPEERVEDTLGVELALVVGDPLVP